MPDNVVVLHTAVHDGIKYELIVPFVLPVQLSQATEMTVTPHVRVSKEEVTNAE